MKSAFECFQRAAQSERRAQATIDPADRTVDPADRTVLLAAAKHWRTLGEEAKTEEAAKVSRTPANSN
jgi:hypothetical protein